MVGMALPDIFDAKPNNRKRSEVVSATVPDELQRAREPANDRPVRWSPISAGSKQLRGSSSGLPDHLLPT